MRTKFVSIIFTVLCLGLVLVENVNAQPRIREYTVYLSQYDTGNTTVAKSGVSLCMLDGTDLKRDKGDTTLKSMESYSGRIALLQIDTLTVSQVQQKQGGTYSGNTFYVGCKSIIPGGNWDLAEMHYATFGMPLSGTSQAVIPFEIPPGDQTRIYFGSSGVTAYDTFKATLWIGVSRDWQTPKPIQLAILQWNLTATTGTSSWASTDSNGKSIPPGTRFILTRTDDLSGVTVPYAWNGGTIPTTKPPCIPAADSWPFVGDLPTLQGVRIKSGSGTVTVYGECWTGNPYVK